MKKIDRNAEPHPPERHGRKSSLLGKRLRKADLPGNVLDV
jgi:hypothetical protein